MDEQLPDRFDTIADFYGKDAGSETDRMIRALESWDHNSYTPLQARDPQLYALICAQVGDTIDILLGQGTVKLGNGRRQIELTWNGDDEDLLDLVLEGAQLINDP
jgi:hypothetical protein